MAKMLNIIIGCMILLGIVTGPTYWLYALFGSGSALEYHNLKPGESEKYRLAPEMNPIRFVLALHLNSGSVSGADDLRAELKHDSQTVWSADFGVRRAMGGGTTGGGSRTRRFLPLVDVDQEGDYEFTVSRVEGSTAIVNIISMKPRRNAWGVNVPMAVAGCVVLLLGIPAFIIVNWKLGKLTFHREGPAGKGGGASFSRESSI